MKDNRQELIKFIDFVTDRFFGERVLPHMLANAIDDYKHSYYKQDGDAFSDAREELRQDWQQSEMDKV